MVQIRYDRKIYEAELADTMWKISRGLSFSFKKRNMFFELPYEAKWPFWMFGMFFPIVVGVASQRDLEGVLRARGINEHLAAGRQLWYTPGHVIRRKVAAIA